jgi:hypothetical protein
MVNPRRLFTILLITASFLIAVSSIPTARAQIDFHLDREWVKIWINQNGTIDLFYNITITSDSGTIHYVKVGQPNGNFNITYAKDPAGNNLTTTNTGDGVQVYLSPSISTGQTAQFSLLTNVGHMIYEDTQNTGNVGMQFIPTWYDSNGVHDLRVLIVLPPGVTQDKVKTSVNWDNLLTEGSSLAVFWERQNLYSNQQYNFGVSFPKQYVQKWETQPTGFTSSVSYGLGILVFIILCVTVIGGVVYGVRKRPYLMPKMSMETLGVKRGLTAVEASYILDMKPPQLVTEMLYSLLQKRAVWVESTNPSLKIKILPPFQDKKGPAETPLRDYEKGFLYAIKDDGTLDEQTMANVIVDLRDNVEEKMRGYCRRDAIDYYRKIVDQAWQQVEQAGTPELASKAYDEQLLWLFLDPNYKTKTETAFRNRTFEPSPLWFWYWYGYQHYTPHPTYKPNIENPGQAAKPPTIPGADFANNIAKAVETTSNNFVVNIEKFANAIIPTRAPPAQKPSSEPVHHAANCVCACVACACACACVSCACACAGGGVG